MAQAVVVVICDICETDKDVQFFCLDCEENLCRSCIAHHSKSKRTKNDKVIPISEAREETIIKTPTILCADHSTEKAAIYCKQCDQLICTECLNGNHEGHNLRSIKQIKSTATDQLVNLRKTLRDRKLSYDDTLKAEGKVHTEYMTAIKKCKEGISDQKGKIIEELNIICDEEFAVLTLLEEKETTRYSEACTNIQKQQKLVTTALQTVQNGIDSGHPASILHAITDSTKSTEGLDDFKPVKLHSPEFQQAHIERQALRQHFGSVYIKSSESRPTEQVMSVVKKERSDAEAPHAPNINKREIDTNNVRIRSTLTVKNKIGEINVIIPVKNNFAWISNWGDTNLRLINDKGDTIKISVQVDSKIEDAKAYGNDILVTCYKKKQVFRLSGDGTTKSIFSDLKPYYTQGLCVTNKMDVLVCLYQSEADKKVVRLGKSGQIILEKGSIIKYNSAGHPLYSWPYRVTTVPTGEILVTQVHHGKVTCVNKDGQHLFTWTGKIGGKQDDRCTTYGITHDNHNIFITDYSYSKVYVLKKDGTGAKCLLDNKQEIVNPWALALDENGLLLIGCNNGKIHKIEY